MKIFDDILSFLKSLSFIDYVFFFAIVVLIILVVTLIYFIKINDDVLVDKTPKKTKKEDLEETQEMKIVKEITKNMVENDSPKETINFTDYEKDQEEKAIISYDELVNKENDYEINYEKEEYYDDLSVKKLDLDNLVTEKGEHVESKFTGRVISFAKEEAFLNALKQLQSSLK